MSVSPRGMIIAPPVPTSRCALSRGRILSNAPPRRPPSRSSSHFGTPTSHATGNYRMPPKSFPLLSLGGGETGRAPAPLPVKTSPDRATGGVCSSSVSGMRDHRVSKESSIQFSLVSDSIVILEGVDTDIIQFHELPDTKDVDQSVDSGSILRRNKDTTLSSEIQFRVEDNTTSGGQGSAWDTPVFMEVPARVGGRGAPLAGARSRTTPAAPPPRNPVRKNVPPPRARSTPPKPVPALNGRQSHLARPRRAAALPNAYGQATPRRKPMEPGPIVSPKRNKTYGKPWRANSAPVRNKTSNMFHTQDSPAPLPRLRRPPVPLQRSPRFRPLVPKPHERMHAARSPVRQLRSAAQNSELYIAPHDMGELTSMPSSSGTTPTDVLQNAREPEDNRSAICVSPPPVLLQPWEIILGELQDWTTLVTQQEVLEQIRKVGLSREQQLERSCRQVEEMEQELYRVNEELYATRDKYIRWCGVDVAARSMHLHKASPSVSRCPRTNSSNRTSRSSSVVARLYPFSPRYTRYTTPSPRMTPHRVYRSCASDDDLFDKEGKEHQQELRAWREERAALLHEKDRLRQQGRDLRHHLHRGTNIKIVSAVRPTSTRPPMERRRTKCASTVDGHHYDELIRLRLEMNVLLVSIQKLHEEYAMLPSFLARQQTELKDDLYTLRVQRDETKDLYAQKLDMLQQTLEEAESLFQRTQSNRSLPERRRLDALTLLKGKLDQVKGTMQARQLNYTPSKKSTDSGVVRCAT